MNTQDEKPLPPPSDRSAIISARRKLVAAGLESLELEIRDVIEDLAEVLRSSGQPCVANALPGLRPAQILRQPAPAQMHHKPFHCFSIAEHG